MRERERDSKRDGQCMRVCVRKRSRVSATGRLALTVKAIVATVTASAAAFTIASSQYWMTLCVVGKY